MQPESDTGIDQRRGGTGRVLYGAVCGCLVATIAFGLEVAPAFRKMYVAFGVDLEPWRSAALSSWCQVGWAAVLVGALVASSSARSREMRDRILASAVWASFAALAFVVCFVVDVRIPLPAIRDW